jgi:hypothetical protein
MSNLHDDLRENQPFDQAEHPEPDTDEIPEEARDHFRMLELQGEADKSPAAWWDDWLCQLGSPATVSEAFDFVLRVVQHRGRLVGALHGLHLASLGNPRSFSWKELPGLIADLEEVADKIERFELSRLADLPASDPVMLFERLRTRAASIRRIHEKYKPSANPQLDAEITDFSRWVEKKVTPHGRVGRQKIQDAIAVLFSAVTFDPRTGDAQRVASWRAGIKAGAPARRREREERPLGGNWPTPGDKERRKNHRMQKKPMD